MKSKRGQMKLSFGMIFSIILIVLFLVLAFYGIKSFLGMKDSVQLKQFQENLELEIERLYGPGGHGTKIFGEDNLLPEGVEEVCFSKPNILEVDLKKGFETVKLEHIEVVTENGEDHFCVTPVNNRVRFTLSKEYGEPLVKVKA